MRRSHASLIRGQFQCLHYPQIAKCSPGMERVRRYVTIFVGDYLVAEQDITYDEFARIRPHLSPEVDVHFYDCYPLKGDLLLYVRELMGERLPRVEGTYDLEESEL